MTEYVILAEYDLGITLDQLAEDLDAIASQFDPCRPVITTNDCGHAEMRLTVDGADLWMSILTAMSRVKHAWYEPRAVQVMTRQEFSRREAA